MPPSGGAHEILLKLDTAHGARAYREPVSLPGDRGILFTISIADTESHDDAKIGVLDHKTGRKKVLIEAGMSARYSPSGHLVYAWQGALLAVPFDLDRLEVTGQPFRVLEGVLMSANTGVAQFDIGPHGTLVYAPGPAERGARSVVWVDRKGNPKPFPLPERSYLHPRLSPDERQLAIEVEGPTHDLFSYEFERGTFTKLTFDGVSHWPLWTPQGDRLTFRSMRTGFFTMWWMPADRSGPEERLTEVGKWQSASSWTPDGRRSRHLDLGLRQRGVAALVGVAKPTVGGWETRGLRPTPDLLPKVVEFLGYEPAVAASPSDLVRGRRPGG